MRILLVISNLGDGGAQKQFGILASALSQVHDLSVCVVFSSEGVNSRFLHESVSRVVISRKNGFDITFAFRLAKFIDDFQPDVVYSWLHSSDVQVYLARRLAKKSFCWVVAERDSFYPKKFRYKIRELSVLRSDCIIANSYKGRDLWLRKFFSKKTAVVRNILEIPNYLAISSKNIVLYAGRFESQKQVCKIAASFIIASKIYPQYRFVMIGAGSHFDDVANILNGSSVELQGYSSAIFEIYACTNVFVNFSLHEGTPNTVIENIALGNKVVLSDIAEHVDLVGEDYPYLLPVSASAEDLAKFIGDALNAKTVKLPFDVKEEFSKNKAVASHVAIFQDVLNAKKDTL